MSQSKEKRPTMSDVAALAGVGSATVDRVLNERGNVREDVRKKVIDAARSLGLRRQLPPSYKPTIRINLILPRPTLPLLASMAEEFKKIARNLERSILLQVSTLADEKPQTIAAALKSTLCDAVIVYAQDHPLIREAIEILHDRDVPVVTMISDVLGTRRLAYAGTNQYAAGRSAGFFVGNMARQGGPAIILCNQLGFQSHAQRVEGFRDYLKQNAPNIEIARIVEGLDDRSRSQALLETAFREIPDAVAVYNVGAANLGVRAAIERNILNERPLFIGHELTKYTSQMLRDGIMTLTIDQSPRLQAQFAIDVLLDHFGYEDVPVSSPYVSQVPIVLYTAEYIPTDM